MYSKGNYPMQWKTDTKILTKVIIHVVWNESLLSSSDKILYRINRVVNKRNTFQIQLHLKIDQKIHAMTQGIVRKASETELKTPFLAAASKLKNISYDSCKPD